LRTEKVDEVRKEIILALGKLQFPGTGSALTAVLRAKTTSDYIKKVSIETLGKSNEGNQTIQAIIGNLSSVNPEICQAASEALIHLNDRFPLLVVPGLSKNLLRAKDKSTLIYGTGVLSRLADESSVNTLISLLSSPYAEVKKNATWGLFRIRSSANPRIAEELNKLANNEAESLPVRINAVRALGAIRYDDSKTRVWKSLVNISKLRSEKYYMLRYFAIEALGEMGQPYPEVISTLSGIALRETDPEISMQAVQSIQKLAVKSEISESALVKLFKKSENPD
ncbi:unnamed protein product, partial [marine sediment metagenome]